MIELIRWETDAAPGFSPYGPQGVVDTSLRIQDADILIGVFWKRFGTPTQDAGSGTEHEFLTAYHSWQETGRPQIMVYFNQKAYLPTSLEEIDQFKHVLEFKRRFPAEGLYWTYNGEAQFEKLARNHLTQYLLQKSPAATSTTYPAQANVAAIGVQTGAVNTGGQASATNSNATAPATNATGQSTPNVITAQPPTSTETTLAANKRVRIFISYRHVEEDTGVASALYAALRPHHDVFIDQIIEIGTDWAGRIQSELERADFLIVLLSEHSVNSEMVGGEVAIAHRRAQREGRPRILPVRLRYKEPLRYPLNSYLDPIQWAVWNGPQDTDALAQQLMQAIGGAELAQIPVLNPAPNSLVSVAPAPAAQPIPLEKPEGTMQADSIFYVAREADRVAIEAIRGSGVTITIKGPRQIGKSSLLN